MTNQVLDKPLRPSILRRNRWQKWEEFCFACLSLALQQLREKNELPEGENALNAMLFAQLRLAARSMRPKGFSYPPIRAECPVQPYGVSDESHRRLRATPDLTWGYEDDREPDALKATRDFVIECKRVRTPTKSGWNFTAHYVEDGINRFRDPVKRYAEGVSCAVMVGYWQDSEAEDLIEEINTVAQSANICPCEAVDQKPSPAIINSYSHSFERPFPVHDFRLEHRWIDLRPAKRQLDNEAVASSNDAKN